jgi:Xaa-Pro aminopeptidase
VTSWLRDHGLTGLGLEGSHVSWADADRWRSVAVDAGFDVRATSSIVEDLRMTKDEAELARIRRACWITTTVLAELLDRLVPGMTEREIANDLEAGFVSAGAEAAAFQSIIASGPNGAIPHHEPGGRVVQAGDLVTIDCGARVDGYHSDCTRTAAVGEPTKQMREVHALVVRAQAAGRQAVVAEAGGRDIDAAARSVVEEGGQGEAFVHGTGHGVGLEIHEDPAIGPRATSTMAAGMTVTVEPGVYLPGIGGVRVEDTVLVTADGPCEILTDLPHDLIVL